MLLNNLLKNIYNNFLLIIFKFDDVTKLILIKVK